MTDPETAPEIPASEQRVPVYATHEALPPTEGVPGCPYEYVLRSSYDRLYEHRLELEQEIAELKAEIATDERLLEGRETLLDAIPECPLHGPCIPHALDWIKGVKAAEAKLEEVRAQRDRLESRIEERDNQLTDAEKEVRRLQREIEEHRT